MKGKLIIIDGTDGSGKATQTVLLVKRLASQGYKVKTEDFPQYGKKSAGLVEDYLNGLYGTGDELGPYIPSMFYALDRFAASQRIRQHLKEGFIVICNRYVTANMAHQGGKIKNPRKRHKYFKWLFELEYGLLRIPKPDLTLILHVPAKIAHKLVANKERRFYIGYKKRDIHEKDMKHLAAAEKTFLEISKKFRYPKIDCAPGNKILSIERIHELIWQKVKKSI
ncbi:MAG: thymidylate kinase [Candidatus Doudnabacteria bacterium]|nr:thymidylate kinase [Candidatus Doudnabacteria bacterium]